MGATRIEFLRGRGPLGCAADFQEMRLRDNRTWIAEGAGLLWAGPIEGRGLSEFESFFQEQSFALLGDRIFDRQELAENRREEAEFGRTGRTNEAFLVELEACLGVGLPGKLGYREGSETINLKTGVQGAP